MSTYYVSSTGDNANPGSNVSPFATVAYAIGVAVNGDTIVVKDIISSNSTIVINKEIILTGVLGSGGLTKPNTGDLISIEASNVTVSQLILSKAATNSADANISIDRNSSGTTLPTIRNNINITNNTFNVFKYAIFVNGSNISISNNIFNRQGGSESITSILVFLTNGLTITGNTVNDTLRNRRFVYLTSSGTTGSTYYNEANNKSGTMVISNNTCNCSSVDQSFILCLQDSFIGSNLDMTVNGNDINLGIPGKVVVSYITNSTDLNSIYNILVHSNNIDKSTSGIVHVDAGSIVTIPTTKKYNVHSNTQQNFTLDPARTGNSNFTQTTATVFPANLYQTTIVQYSEPTYDYTSSNSGNVVDASSTDSGVTVGIQAIIPTNEKYCDPIVYYGSIFDLNITSSASTALTINVPKANSTHVMYLYKRELTGNTSPPWPILCTHVNGTTWTATIPSSSNISVIDVNAVGVPI